MDEIHFSGATLFAAAELRAQVSLRHGDLFNVLELFEGLDSMARLYGRRGFIDMVAQLEETVDDKSLLINVLVKVDEGQQYRVRSVEIQGLDLQAEQALKSQLALGQVFDGVSLTNFFKEHKAGLRADGSFGDAIQVRRDVTDATVDLLVDFRPCSKT